MDNSQAGLLLAPAGYFSTRGNSPSTQRLQGLAVGSSHLLLRRPWLLVDRRLSSDAVFQNENSPAPSPPLLLWAAVPLPYSDMLLKKVICIQSSA